MSKVRTKRLIVGGILVGGALTLIAFLQFGENVVYFYTPDEAKQNAEKLSQSLIRLGGMVQPGSVQWQAENLDLRFIVTDFRGNDVRVVHRGAPPDMFKEGQGVVVEGRLAADGSSIQSRKLMVKHSEEYKKPGDHSKIDRELLEKSMFKN